LRIVFLDFDGVLNSRALVERAPAPAPYAIGLDLRAKGLRTASVLDVTPMIPYKRGRGQEIQAWLDRARAPIDGMVILDDEPDMLHLLPWLVQSSFKTGLTDAHLAAARRVLRRSAPILHVPPQR